jgi:NAD-dependent DNA ligase
MSSKKPKGTLSAAVQIQYANEGSDQWELTDVRRTHATRTQTLAKAIAAIAGEEMETLFFGLPIPEVGDSVAAKLRLVIEIDWRCFNGE